ncbi:Sulfate/thiosulfate import ATP-binding protein CysA [Novipirellula aureliae]|uniref:Sulfate/thiosulfate import ATP-binding protein CysA n=1 Tax=Novipirellula aureliae TaxID=2527966 RepID=A0A5C6E9X4_9BACT|nr:ATP-binding cassette domain-containing protein [Novipirellula aureliae]TWU45335.1 Sulfate/thiosulfate import ATP-binding protein CysA [Novipirellula aureliae]
MTFSFRGCYHRETGFMLEAAFQTDARVTAICGPSGSGKTTLLSLIAGLLKPTEACICAGDHVFVDTQKGICIAPEKRQIGFLFQEDRLFPHLRVKANIEYAVRRRGDGGIAFKDLVQTLELEEVLHRFPDSLSGGQRHRVALARAVASRPKLLLLDEPMSAIEDVLRDRITTFVKRLIDEFQIPTLLVSHNRVLVERMASKVIEMNKGKIVGQNT